VRDRNKITIKDVIEICAKHARVKNVKNGSMDWMLGIQLKTKVNVVFFGIQDDGKIPEKFCEFCTSGMIIRWTGLDSQQG
jgi:hypothetical protein